MGAMPPVPVLSGFAIVMREHGKTVPQATEDLQSAEGRKRGNPSSRCYTARPVRMSALTLQLWAMAAIPFDEAR